MADQGKRLTPETVAYLRRLREKMRLPVRECARRCRVARNTARKYLRSEH